MMAINRLKGLLGTVPKTDDVVASLFESPAGNTTGSPFRSYIYSQQIGKWRTSISEKNDIKEFFNTDLKIFK